MEHILEVKNLNVSFKSYLGTVRAVQGVDFVLDQKETAGDGRRIRLRKDGDG